MGTGAPIYAREGGLSFMLSRCCGLNRGRVARVRAAHRCPASLHEIRMSVRQILQACASSSPVARTCRARTLFDFNTEGARATRARRATVPASFSREPGRADPPGLRTRCGSLVALKVGEMLRAPVLSAFRESVAIKSPSACLQRSRIVCPAARPQFSPLPKGSVEIRQKFRFGQSIQARLLS